MREDHGFRLLDYSVDSDSASPRACFQFSEELPSKRGDFSPFVSVAGQDKPARISGIIPVQMSAVHTAAMTQANRCRDAPDAIRTTAHNKMSGVTLSGNVQSKMQNSVASPMLITYLVESGDKRPSIWEI
jgi:hypothetical protein